jgi:hypothetical protein
MKVAQKVLRAALISANPMEVVRDAHIQIAARVPRAAHSSARATEEGNAVQLKAAQRVSMVALNSVLPMEVESDVWYQDAPRVLEDEQTAVFVMVGAKDANLLAAVRVHRGALTFARLMVEASVAYGANQDLTLPPAVLLASDFQGERMDCVSHTMLWWKTAESVVGRHLVLWAYQDLLRTTWLIMVPFTELRMVSHSTLLNSVKGPTMFCILQGLFITDQYLLPRGGCVVVILLLCYLLV